MPAADKQAAADKMRRHAAVLARLLDPRTARTVEPDSVREIIATLRNIADAMTNSASKEN